VLLLFVHFAIGCRFVLASLINVMAACRTKLAGACKMSASGDSELISSLKRKLRKAQAQLAIARNEASYRYIVDGNFLPLFEENDVLTFFNMFERMCALCDAVPAIYCKLLETRLTSKATRMVSQLSADRRHDYNAVKNAILAGYHCVSGDDGRRAILLVDPVQLIKLILASSLL
jgi:hypothetical protein